MRIVVWLVEGTWEAAVDAVGDRAGEVELVHVLPDDVTELWRQAPSGLLGRSARFGDPGPLDEAGGRLLVAAELRLGRPAERRLRHGREEVEVLAACADAELLIVARDGDLSHRGPRSLGRATRFVVDHAPCTVLLVWPDAAPTGVDRPPARRDPTDPRC
jgi:nucleotide-binding universal stress UspA family protein